MESNHIFSSHFQEELAATSDDHLFGNTMATWPLNGADLHGGDEMLNPQHLHYNSHQQSAMDPNNSTGGSLGFTHQQQQQQHMHLQDHQHHQQLQQPSNPAAWGMFNMPGMNRAVAWHGSNDASAMMAVPHQQDQVQQSSQTQQAQQQPSQTSAQQQQQQPHNSLAYMSQMPAQFNQQMPISQHSVTYYQPVSAQNMPPQEFQPLDQFPQDLNPLLPNSFGQPPPMGTSPPSSLSYDHHSPASSGIGSWVEVASLASSSGRNSFDEHRDHVNPVLVAAASSDGRSSPETHVSPEQFIAAASYEEQYGERSSALTINIPSGRSQRDVAMAVEGTSPNSGTSSADDSNSPTSPASNPSTASSKRNSRNGPSAKSSKSNSSKKPTAGAVSKSGTPASTDRKVGKRKGPLAPDRRRQAGEIRKLRACLRCRFLKKTCDTGDPCQGCQPAHTRLWIVPCTRKGVNELHFFLYNWKSDYERHMKVEFTPFNIKEYGKEEVALWITHGFDIVLPVNARRAWAKDESCFQVDWVETYGEHPESYECGTETLTTSQHGLDQKMLHQYVERHVDSDFVGFVDREFEGTAFLSEMLKVAHDYYRITKLPVVHKALKFVVAYNLTQHLTLIEGITDESGYMGKVDDPQSRFHNRYVAPALINFEIKATLAQVWRQLHKEVLEELANLFAGSYSGNKTQNWPTIFVVCFVVLSMWELMQFDAHYHGPSAAAATSFCQEMEGVPVGVLLGLFSAVSQKLPNFVEWDTSQHQQLVNYNQDICAIFTQVREHIVKYETYLRDRASTAVFNAEDFDCLCNKLTAKLVLKPTTSN